MYSFIHPILKLWNYVFHKYRHPQPSECPKSSLILWTFLNPVKVHSRRDNDIVFRVSASSRKPYYIICWVDPSSAHYWIDWIISVYVHWYEDTRDIGGLNYILFSYNYLVSCRRTLFLSNWYYQCPEKVKWLILNSI